jgi:hypothetical protein
VWWWCVQRDANGERGNRTEREAVRVPHDPARLCHPCRAGRLLVGTRAPAVNRNTWLAIAGASVVLLALAFALSYKVAGASGTQTTDPEQPARDEPAPLATLTVAVDPEASITIVDDPPVYVIDPPDTLTPGSGSPFAPDAPEPASVASE